MRDKIRWGRMLLEGVVIVGSILLAFGIDAWWDVSRDRNEEEDVLRGLAAEFSAHRGEIHRFLERNDQFVAAAALLLQVGRQDIPVPTVEVLDTALWQVQRAPTWDPEAGVHSAMVNAGGLALIQNDDLRQLLAGWEGAVEEARDNELLMRQYIFTSILPHLASAGVPLGRVIAVGRGAWPASLPTDDETLEAYLRTIRDPEYESLLSVRYNWAVLSSQEYRDLLDRIDQTIGLIESEIR